MPDFDPVERAGFVAELAFAESAVQAVGYRTETTDPEDPAQVPELIVHLDDDERQRPRTLRLSFIPVGDEMESSKFLQMWAPLPFSAPAAVRNEVRQAVTIVNEHVAIGRFGMHSDGSLYFRYVLAARKHQMIDDDLLAEVVRFADFHQEHFGDYLDGVCDGEIVVDVLEQIIAAAGDGG